MLRTMNRFETSKQIRWTIGCTAIVGLLLVFLFQGVNISTQLMPNAKPIVHFLLNRSIRFFLNDMFAIMLIYALFPSRQYVIFAIWVQLLGTVFILLPYFLLKLNFPSYNGPLLSFLHRLILNPTLILLLIPAFYYQRSTHRPG